MAKRCFPVAQGRSPRRRVVRTWEDGTMGPFPYTWEALECGHSLWCGTSANYSPARHRACTQCRDEEREREERESDEEWAEASRIWDRER